MPETIAARAPIATVLAAALLLGGCQTAFDLVGVATPLSAEESHHFDGSYQGSVELVTDTNPACRRGEPERVVQIGDGVLWYAYGPSASFSLPVSYDGRIVGRSGDTTLNGRITGNHLQATIKSAASTGSSSGACEAEMSMDYVYNHS